MVRKLPVPEDNGLPGVPKGYSQPETFFLSTTAKEGSQKDLETGTDRI